MWILFEKIKEFNWETNTSTIGNNPTSTNSISDSLKQEFTKDDYKKLRNKLNQNYLWDFSYLISIVEKSNNKKFKKEVSKILSSILKEQDTYNISELALNLQKKVSIYEISKEKIKKVAKENWENLSDEIIEAKEIENYQEYIKDLLLASDWFLWTIESSLDNAKEMSDEDLVSTIQWTLVPFDVEPEDWDIYFEENNVPKSKQNQFKSFFKNLKWEKAWWWNPISSNWHDMWNIWFKDDFWDDIWNEAERILNLEDWETIEITIKDLNPEWWNLEFETKKDALLYLYYNKLLLREVGTFLEDIIQWGTNIKDWVIWIWNFIANNPWFSTGLVLSYMWIATAWSMYRYTNAYFIRAQSWSKKVKWYNPITYVPTKWDLINIPNDWESLSTEPKLKKEQDEWLRRKKVIKMLKEKHKWNNKKIKQIKKIEKKWMRILDHDIQIEWKKAPFEEWTFWREVAYIEADWLKWPRKIIDTTLKLFLKASEESETDIENKVKLYNEVKKEIFEEKWIIEQAKTFIKRSHEIPNDMEGKILEIFEKLEKKYKKWEFYHLKWENNDDLKKAIKEEIINKINKNTWLETNEKLFKEWLKLENAKDLFFGNQYDRLKPKDSVWIIEQWVEILFRKYNLSEYKITQIEKLFAEIDEKWGNEYNKRTALDILARLVNKDINFENARKESFEIKWEYVKNINIDSDLKWSLDTLLEKINKWEYKLDWPKREDIKKPKIEENENSRKKFFEENWSRLEWFYTKWTTVYQAIKDFTKAEYTRDKAYLEKFANYVKQIWLWEKYNKLKTKINQSYNIYILERMSELQLQTIMEHNTFENELKRMNLELVSLSSIQKTEFKDLINDLKKWGQDAKDAKDKFIEKVKKLKKIK